MARRRKTLPIQLEPELKCPIPLDDQVLGRNLGVAFIAAQQGIGLDYARKKYAQEPVGEFWRSVARMVIDHFAYTGVPPRRPPTIH